MDLGCEKVKKEIFMVADMHTKQNREKRVHGERIPIPVSGRDVETAFYRADSKDAPTLFTAFGGGFVMGGCALDDNMWTSISRDAQVNIISIGYRKTPEYQFPAALDDVYETMCCICEHAEEYGINPEKAAIMGASAGGNLAAAATLMDRRNGTDYIKLLILNYPYLDLATPPEKKGHQGGEIFLYRLFPELYASEDELRNPLVSPLYAGSQELEKLPPVYITVAGDDVLQDEGKAFADKICDAGGKAEVNTAEKMPHGYLETWFNLTDPEANPATMFLPEETKLLYENGKLEKEEQKTCEFIKRAIRDTFN